MLILQSDNEWTKNNAGRIIKANDLIVDILINEYFSKLVFNKYKFQFQHSATQLSTTIIINAVIAILISTNALLASISNDVSTLICNDASS